MKPSSVPTGRNSLLRSTTRMNCHAQIGVMIQVSE